MLIGQSVLAPTGGADYYTPWVPRQGDALTAVVEVLRTSGTIASFSCAGQTKNHEDSDADAVALAGSPLTVTTTAGDVSKAVFSDAKELVRYKYSIAGSSSLRWVHFRANPMIWLPN